MRLVSLLFCMLFMLFSNAAFAQTRASWIWYPGDFEIWLSNKTQTKRVVRDVTWPPFWRMYSHQPQVNFTRRVDLAAPEEIMASVEGKYNVTIDGQFIYGDQRRIKLPAGKHTINFQVFNSATPPAILVQGKTVQSDGAWTVGPVPNYTPANGALVQAALWKFDTPEQPPSSYKLATREVAPRSVKRGKGSVLVDFGQETIGFVKLKHLKGKGKLTFYYGESLEEALSPETCETLDSFTVDAAAPEFVAGTSRALRYVNIQYDEGIAFDDVSLLYEYLPVTQRGTFKSSDPELNKIWDVAIRTLELNTREFFIDGIKRDHWLWSGDAVQSYLMNYYSFFDADVVKRTLWGLRGADPVDMHINTILDYSLYWFIGINDYYRHTGDTDFLKSIYPRMVTMMDFVLNRRNKNGMLEGLHNDWVFIDWAPMAKDGELSVIQLLFARSLDAMAETAALVKDDSRAATYRQLSAELKSKITATFWDPQRQLYVHSRKDGTLNQQVTRYPNMFALMFGYLNAEQSASVASKVLMNDKVQKITTPYMRFYELAALAEIGQQAYVTGQIKDYWGGMLREGATCFWEQYDPNVKGAAKYAMYGKPFGMSLCHAWGASPIYLLGKYYLGVTPSQPGYSSYAVEPNLGGLAWLEGKVPTPLGDVGVAINAQQIKVSSVAGKGVLRFRSASKPSSKDGVIKHTGADRYELAMDSAKDYVVRYTAVKR